MITRILPAGFAAWFLSQLFTSAIWEQAPGAAILTAILGLITVLPFLRWFYVGSNRLPAVEVYTGMHFTTYVLPQIQSTTMETTSNVVEETTLIVMVYLISVNLAYNLWRLVHSSTGPMEFGFLRRDLSNGTSQPIAWPLLLLWYFGTMLFFFQLNPDLKAYTSYVTTLLNVGGKIAIFLLFYSVGTGTSNRARTSLLIFIISTQVLIDFASGFLIGGATTTLTAILAYSLGSNRIPWASALTLLGVFWFLHLGKAEMRNQFWASGANYSAERINPIKVYQVWIPASLRYFDSDSRESLRNKETFVRRAGMMRWVTLVVTKTPSTIPYLDGLTYKMIPPLFLPRALTSDKGRVSAPTERLAIEYGIQTEASVETTSVGMGQIAEAWANFGWFGIVVVGACMGSILAIPLFLGGGRSVSTVGYLLGIPALVMSYNMELCVGPLVHAWVLHTSLLSLLLLFVTRRKTGQPEPCGPHEHWT